MSLVILVLFLTIAHVHKLFESVTRSCDSGHHSDVVHMKKISVITVTYNAAGYLEDTISSVLSQDYENVEYILMDGASTDGTLDIANRYRKYIDVIISQPDLGVYDAMNKGVALATGELINFMNAGDRFYQTHTVANVAEISGECDLIYGDTILDFSSYTKLIKAKHSRVIWKGNVCTHQSLFTKRKLLLDHPFKQELAIHADYEFMLWAVSQGVKICSCNRVISVMNPDGISRQSMVKTALSQYRVARGYFNGPMFHVYEIYKIVKVVVKASIKRLLPKKVFRYLHPLGG